MVAMGFINHSKIEECAICFEELSTNVTTKCNHTFCKTCMFNHLKKKTNCPMCRRNIFSFSNGRMKELTGGYLAWRRDIFEQMSGGDVLRGRDIVRENGVIVYLRR